MTETIVFPDAVSVCVEYGQAALIATGDTDTIVNARVTNDERQVTLSLTDSEVHSIVVQRSTIQCEIRTGDGPLAQEEAQDLGQLMRGAFGAMAGTVQSGETIYKVVDAQGLADSPDEKNGNSRYVFFFTISMRGAALVAS